jgi:hypothetical protein
MVSLCSSYRKILGAADSGKLVAILKYIFFQQDFARWTVTHLSSAATLSGGAGLGSLSSNRSERSWFWALDMPKIKGKSIF